MAGNHNHPKKGSFIQVEPFRKFKDIRKIRSILKGTTRDRLIFDLGINTNLRAKDLISIEVGMVRYLKPGQDLLLKESKTRTTRSITLNHACYRSIKRHLKSEAMREATDEDYLFQSRKGKEKLRTNTLTALVKTWAWKADIEGNFGSHSLRKTFGYIHRIYWETDIPTLMEIFNHSNQRQTLRYLCVQPKEIKSVYMKEI